MSRANFTQPKPPGNKGLGLAGFGRDDVGARAHPRAEYRPRAKGLIMLFYANQGVSINPVLDIHQDDLYIDRLKIKYIDIIEMM